MKPNFKLNNQYTANPINWDNTLITLEFEPDNNTPVVNIDKVKFAGEDCKFITDLIANTSYFKKIPFNIEIGSLDFEMNLDTSSIIGNDRFLTFNVLDGQKQTFSELAKNVNFHNMEVLGKFTKADTVEVFFQKSHNPDAIMQFILAFTLYNLAQETYKAVLKVIDDILTVLAAISQLSIGSGATSLLIAIGKALISSAYAAFLVVQIFNLLKELWATFVPPIYSHRACLYSKLLEKGCGEIGYTFKYDTSLASILDDLYYIPARISDYMYGIPTAKDYINNLFKAFEQIKYLLNAKLSIKNKEVTLVLNDKAINSYGFPNIDLTEKDWNINANDLKLNVIMQYAMDSLEQNTLQYNEGAILQVQYKLKGTNTQDNELIKKDSEVVREFPFSLAKFKTSYTFVEELLLNFLKGIDFILQFWDVDFAEQIEERKGIMLSSEREFAVGKVAMLKSDGKMKYKRFETPLKLDNIFEMFHAKTDFRTNQFKVYKGLKVPFCYNDFISFVNDGRYVTAFMQGVPKIVRFDKIEWKPEWANAVVDISVEDVYEQGIKYEMNIS